MAGYMQINNEECFFMNKKKVISFQGRLFEVRANILGTLILSEKCDSVRLYRLDNCVLKEI